MNEFPIDRPTQSTPFDSVFVTSTSTTDRSAPGGGSFGEYLLKLNDRPAVETPRQRRTEDSATAGSSDDRQRDRTEHEATIDSDQSSPTQNEEQTVVSEQRNNTDSTDERPSDDRQDRPNGSQDASSSVEEPATEQGEANEALSEEPSDATDRDSDVGSENATSSDSDVAASDVDGQRSSTEINDTDESTEEDVAAEDAKTKNVMATDLATQVGAETDTLKEDANKTTQTSVTGQASDSTVARGQVATAESGGGGPNVEAAVETPGDRVTVAAEQILASDAPQLENQNITAEGKPAGSDSEGKATALGPLSKAGSGSVDATSEETEKQISTSDIAAVDNSRKAGSEGALSVDRTSHRRKENGRRIDAATKPTSLAPARSAEPVLRNAVAASILEALSTAEGESAGTTALSAEQSDGESAKPTGRDGNAPKPATVARLQSAMARTANASSTEGKTETTVDRVRFVERVARAFQTAVRRGDEQIRLRLSPANLGSLSLEVSMKGGELTARLEAETNSARTLLLDNLGTLRDRLAEEGIKIEKFDVELSDRQSQQGLSGDAQRQTTGRRSRDNQQTTENESDNEAATPATASANMQNDDDRLNVVI